MTADETNLRTDLSDLTRTRAEELGLSYRALAEAAIDPKGPGVEPLWKRSTIENLIKARPVKPPREPELRALAAALQLPVRAVQEAAAAQFFGLTPDYVWSDDHTVRVIVARAEEMEDEEREQLAAIAETFAQRRANSDGKTGK